METCTVTLLFEDEEGTRREHTQTVAVGREGSPAGEARLFEELLGILKVSTHERQPLVHNAVARKWLDFPKVSYDFSVEIFDNIRNTQELWRELCNLVLSVEHDLHDAESFKALEPSTAPGSDDDEGLERLHMLHRQKMDHLNRGVYGLIKVQDLVNRLLHEAFGGHLVRTDHADWEKKFLTRENINKQLDQKVQEGDLTAEDRQAIENALGLPDQTAGHDVAVRYRNRLTHHINPSVDYPIFYSQLHSREFVPQYDETGAVVSMTKIAYTSYPADYLFNDLLAAYMEQLDAVVEMLTRLTAVPMLHL